MPVTPQPVFALNSPAPRPARFGQAKPLYRNNPKPILLSMDFDHTLIRWLKGDDKAFDEVSLQRNVNAVRDAYPVAAVHLNTGRGLHYFQKAAQVAAPILAKMPLDYLSLDNGRELYINKRHERTDKWIARLRTADMEQSWQSQIGWDAGRVNQAIHELLAAEGFTQTEVTQSPNLTEARYTKTEAGLTWMVRTLDNPSAWLMYVKPDAGEASVFDEPQRARGHRMAEQLLQTLSGLGIEARYGLEEKHDGNVHYGFFVISPVHVDKAAAIGQVLTHYLSNPKAVITAGDSSYNDTPALKPEAFTAGKTPRTVPNYPIVVGEDATLVSAVQDNPRHEVSREKRLDRAIAAQVEKTGTRLNYCV